MTVRILIEGCTKDELLSLPAEEFAAYVFCGRPLVIHIGTAEVLGEFRHTNTRLTLELAQIDGGGEGVLPAIGSIAQTVARRMGLREIEWIVHAINCAKPNLKLREVLVKRGFEIRHVEGAGEAYYQLKTLD